MKLTDDNKLLLLYDLYFLRFEKAGTKWHELTDYLRDKLKEDGLSVSYTKDDLILTGSETLPFGTRSMKEFIKIHKEKKAINN